MKKLLLSLLILSLGFVASCDNNDSSETHCPDVQLAELEQIMSVLWILKINTTAFWRGKGSLGHFPKG